MSCQEKMMWLVGAASLVAGAPQGRAADGVVLMASTIGPIDAGIVPLLEDRFEAETGIRVRHVGAGTGEALKLAEQGSFDLVLVHARALEEKFVADGFGTERIPVMYNDFVIVGPAADPAGVGATKSAAGALQAIARASARFVSRGDRSGTHVAEMGLWDRAGLKPAGPWYLVYERGAEGNAATLRYADREGAYTVIDRATWLSLRDGLRLALLLEKDEALLNFISLIPVSAAKFPRANQAGAAAFAEWLTAPAKGQRIVEEFGREKYGSPLFFPNSRGWKPPAAAAPAGGPARTVVLATTTAARDSGLLAALLPVFEQAAGWRVKAVAAGSAQAVAMARKGEADLVLSSSPAEEQKLLDDGYAVSRRPVMRDEFPAAGPSADPAKIQGAALYHAMEASPARWPKVDAAGARALADFLVSPRAQELIGSFGADKSGSPRFTPVGARALPAPEP